MEIERKFLINSIPEEMLKACESAEIEQFYLDFGEGDAPEGRIRKLTQNGATEYIYTEKGKGDLCREEEEYEISEYSYERLKDLSISSTLTKTRYYLSLDDRLTAEIDVYGGSLSGLTVAEVEFSTLEEAQKFIPPQWFDEEITYDKKYKNKNLSKNNSIG